LAAGNNYNIYDEMRHDDQVKVVLSLKKDMAINSGWRIACDNEDIREFITDNLMHGMDQSLDTIMYDIMSSYDYGFSLSEPIYELKEGLYHWKSIKTRPPHTFRFDIDRFGNILSIIQNTSIGEFPHDQSKFVHNIYQPEFGNPYGRSDLRAAHDPWKAQVNHGTQRSNALPRYAKNHPEFNRFDDPGIGYR